MSSFPEIQRMTRDLQDLFSGGLSSERQFRRHQETKVERKYRNLARSEEALAGLQGACACSEVLLWGRLAKAEQWAGTNRIRVTWRERVGCSMGSEATQVWRPPQRAT